MDGRSGALDFPGATWRDRPAVERGDGVYLCGDQVAAPGCLAEVAFASAIEAGTRAPEHVQSGALRLIRLYRLLNLIDGEAGNFADVIAAELL